MGLSPGGCPCGSGREEGACCGRLMSDSRAMALADAVMRSRYTAYVRGNEAWLLKSWHPSTRPDSLDLSRDRTTWLALRVLHVWTDGDGAEVEFRAWFRDGDGVIRVLHERSRFVRSDQPPGWLYLDGRCRLEKPGRNEPCFCGSGRKFKRCCALPRSG